MCKTTNDSFPIAFCDVVGIGKLVKKHVALHILFTKRS